MYGCETWRLDSKTMRMLNSANSVMLSRITGNSIPNEARSITTNHNLVRCIRIVRYKFLGSILRSATLPSGHKRLTYHALTHKYAINENGNILMNAPTSHTHITRKPCSPSYGQSYMECRDSSNSLKIIVPSGPKLLYCLFILFNIYQLFKENQKHRGSSPV